MTPLLVGTFICLHYPLLKFFRQGPTYRYYITSIIPGFLFLTNQSHRIHGDWYIYLHEWLIFMANVGKYTIHGSYGSIIYFMDFGYCSKTFPWLSSGVDIFICVGSF